MIADRERTLVDGRYTLAQRYDAVQLCLRKVAHANRAAEPQFLRIGEPLPHSLVPSRRTAREVKQDEVQRSYVERRYIRLDGSYCCRSCAATCAIAPRWCYLGRHEDIAPIHPCGDRISDRLANLRLIATQHRRVEP